MPCGDEKAFEYINMLLPVAVSGLLWLSPCSELAVYLSSTSTFQSLETWIHKSRGDCSSRGDLPMWFVENKSWGCKTYKAKEIEMWWGYEPECGNCRKLKFWTCQTVNILLIFLGGGGLESSPLILLLCFHAKSSIFSEKMKSPHQTRVAQLRKYRQDWTIYLSCATPFPWLAHKIFRDGKEWGENATRTQ